MRPLLLLAALSLSLPAFAEDIVVLVNQSEMVGRIMSDDGDHIVIDVKNPAGRVEIAYDDIAFINGLSAERLRSYRMTTSRAEKILASRGVAIPSGLKKETRGIPDFTERMLSAEQDTWTNLGAHMKSLSKFGLVPPGYDGIAGLPRIRATRRYAWYDADEQTLRLIVPNSSEPGRFEPFWTAAGRKPEMLPITREVGRAALIAMFNLDKRRRALPPLTDAALAFDAAVTGLATAMALDAALEPNGLDRGQGDSWAALIALSGAEREVADLPEFFQEWRLFPMHEGARFHRAAYLVGGWRLALRTLDDPPVSTEQILHPEKYFAARDVPTQVSLACPPMPEGATHLGFVGSGELGEAMIINSLTLALKDEKTARKAAEGWDGDAYIVLASGESSPALVWFTVWDTPQDAVEFAEAAADAALRRSERGKKSVSEGRTILDTAAGFGLVEVKDREVVVVESVPSMEAATYFAEAAWRDVVKSEPKPTAAPLASAEELKAALGDEDELAKWWPAGMPKADPISGMAETDGKGVKVFTAPGAFSIVVPEGWEVKAEPTSLVLSKKSGADTLTATLTFHRTQKSVSPSLVFTRAWRLACPEEDGLILAWETKTADGRGWFQFAPRDATRRVHLSWAVSSQRVVRVEAVAPAAGAPEDARRQLQEALASLKFLR